MKETKHYSIQLKPFVLIHDIPGTVIIAVPAPVKPAVILNILNPLFGTLTSEGKGFLLKLQGFIEKDPA